jgi:hypothetical protein
MKSQGKNLLIFFTGALLDFAEKLLSRRTTGSPF